MSSTRSRCSTNYAGAIPRRGSIGWSRPIFAELLQPNPAIANVIEFPRDEWSTPWRWAPYVERGAADRPAARRAIRSRARSARPIAQCHFCLRLRRAGADRLRQAARRRAGSRCRDQFRTRRKSTPGRARAKAAGSLIRITLRCRRSTCIRSSAISASRRCSASTARPDFSFPIPQEATTRIDALLGLLRHRQSQAARRHGARHQLGHQAVARATVSPKWRGIFCKRPLPSS